MYAVSTSPRVFTGNAETVGLRPIEMALRPPEIPVKNDSTVLLKTSVMFAVKAKCHCNYCKTKACNKEKN